MNYIKSLHIEGFKKFISLDVEFNEHMNILVGENEAGKSTILDAIKTVLNQQYRNADKSILRDLFNTQMVAIFEANPSLKTLPRILIEVELALEPKTKNADYFYGEVYGLLKNKTKSLAYALSVSTMSCWVQVWNSLFKKEKSRMSTMLLVG